MKWNISELLKNEITKQFQIGFRRSRGTRMIVPDRSSLNTEKQRKENIDTALFDLEKYLITSNATNW